MEVCARQGAGKPILQNHNLDYWPRMISSVQLIFPALQIRFIQIHWKLETHTLGCTVSNPESLWHVAASATWTLLILLFPFLFFPSFCVSCHLILMDRSDWTQTLKQLIVPSQCLWYFSGSGLTCSHQLVDFKITTGYHFALYVASL